MIIDYLYLKELCYKVASDITEVICLKKWIILKKKASHDWDFPVSGAFLLVSKSTHFESAQK